MLLRPVDVLHCVGAAAITAPVGKKGGTVFGKVTSATMPSAWRSATRRSSSQLRLRPSSCRSRNGFVLTVLADGAARPIGEVARLARMDAGAVSRQLNRLEDDGYVRRDGATRGSVVLVTATKRGRALLDKVEAVRNDQLQRALAGWTVDEQAELGRLLVRLADDLRAAPYLPVR